jgi:hypothetical protein
MPIVQLKVALPDAFVLSFAVTVLLYEPAVVGVPEIRPLDALIDKPAGRPVADHVSARPPESLPDICRLFAVPTVPVWLPGFVTVTVLPPVPWVTIGCEIAQLFVSFDHDACSA